MAEQRAPASGRDQRASSFETAQFDDLLSHRRVTDPLRHHGDVEVRGAGLLDFAVNVYPGPRPLWLDAGAAREPRRGRRLPVGRPAPRPRSPRRTAATRDEVLATAGAAEAFTLLARARPWRRPVVVHPQFTEPHAALEQAGHPVTEVVLPRAVRRSTPPWSPTTPTSSWSATRPTRPACCTRPTPSARCRGPGRLVVVDEAFMDAVPGEAGDAGRRRPASLVVRSLTKHWSIPGVRAGYARRTRRRGRRAASGAVAVVGLDDRPRRRSGPARPTPPGPRPSAAPRRSRAGDASSTDGLDDLGIPHVPSSASFVLARVGEGVHAAAARRRDRRTPGRHLPRPGRRRGSGSRSGRRRRPHRSADGRQVVTRHPVGRALGCPRLTPRARGSR